MNQEELQEFPNSMGFGRLKPESITTDGKTRIANYYFRDMRVHEVKLEHDGRAMITDYFNEERLTISSGSNLERAILHHYMCWQPATHKFMQYYMKEVSGLGNIYFQQMETDKQRIVYSPAGHLFLLQIPICSRNVDQINDNAVDLDVLYNPYCYETKLITFLKDGEVDRKDIDMLNIVVPMAKVYSTVREFIRQGIVAPGKRFQMIIQEVSSAVSDRVHRSYANDGDTWSHYDLYLETLMPRK